MPFLSDLVESMFFRPDERSYWNAALYGLRFQQKEIVIDPKQSVRSEILFKDEKDLTKSGPWVLFFHSAQFNMSYNLQQIAFIALEGIPVVMFDYRGCGRSKGEINLALLPEDADAVYRMLSDSGFKPESFKECILMGQGVGADALLRFYERHREEVSAVLIESCYATQKGWLEERYGPVVGNFVAKLLKETDRQPVEVIQTVDCPLILVTPGSDDFVRRRQRALLRAAAPQGTIFWDVRGKKYLGVFSDNDSPFRPELIRFIRRVGKTSK